MTGQTPLAADGEPCDACAAPLAADQRYCLACGARRAHARPPFLALLQERRPAPGAPVVAPPVRASSLVAQTRENTGLIATVGVLLLSMLIGVLVGSGFANDDGVAASADPKPVVVSVAGAAVAPAAAALPTDDALAPGAKGDEAAAGKDGKAKDPGPSRATIKPKVASKQKLQSLDKLSGAAYQKQVDKLGKNIDVGGKAPPKDDKPAAGGGAFEDIG